VVEPVAWCLKVERPQPKDSQLLVKVHGARNFPDILMVAGEYQVKPPLPFAGLQSQARSRRWKQSQRFAVGDRVLSQISRRFRRVRRRPGRDDWRIPAAMSFDEAAFPLVYQTSYFALVLRPAAKARPCSCIRPPAAWGWPRYKSPARPGAEKSWHRRVDQAGHHSPEWRPTWPSTTRPRISSKS
jgi:hypothetical protein